MNGQRPDGPPVYFDTEPAAALIPSGSVIPSGCLWKWSGRERQSPDPRAWNLPVTLEQAAARLGRKRGQDLLYTATDVLVRPEAYERRLVFFLAQARRNLANLIQRGGGPRAFSDSAPI